VTGSEPYITILEQVWVDMELFNHDQQD